ncbi:hypothetical protein vseg_016177 [Gypsophila vaccaria]
MDSLLSSYASSSDDDDDHHPPPPRQQPHQPPRQPPSSTKPTSSLFASLPPPSSTKDLTFLPSNRPESGPATNPHLGRGGPAKRVVQFHPPKFSQTVGLRGDKADEDEDDDDDDDEKEREIKRSRQTVRDTSAKSFLSSMPAPKNSGLGGGGPTGGRRTTIDAPVADNVSPEPPAPNVDVVAPNASMYSYDNEGYEQQHYYDGSVSGWSYGGSEGGLEGGGLQGTGPSGVESFVGGGGGRRRKDRAPVEIVEVKQDELMKNRPTQDKSKLTGIAFGPSYQPVSSKGKPSKLHKRKHQIGSLYFDVKQSENDHAERRAKGFLTKAQTQAKYGW